MSNYKPFEKDKMTIEKAIKTLKEPPDFSLNYYNRENAIDVLLTAYEKEKEKNKEILLGNIENFQKYFLEEFNKKFISIDKLKQIVDECIPKKENIITRELEYTPNANANSYLTQEILSLLKEE